MVYAYRGGSGGSLIAQLSCSSIEIVGLRRLRAGGLPLHDIAITNIVWCMHTGGWGRGGGVCRAVVLQSLAYADFAQVTKPL